MEKIELEIKMPPSAIMYGIFVVLAGFLLPVFLIPLIKLVGYSEIFEEIAKALVVLFLILKIPDYKMKIFAGIAFGFLFGVSENFLYLNQIFQLGDLSIFWQRFLWTVPMHMITALVLVVSGLTKKHFLILGLVGAIILHVLFNGMVIAFY